MKGAIVHGVLLVVMLVYGYRTWTRDKTVSTTGTVRMWQRAEADLTAIVLESPKRTVRIETRNDGKENYWWGVETKVEPKPKPAPAPGTSPAPTAPPGHPPMDPHGGHGHGTAPPPTPAGSGSAAKPATPPAPKPAKAPGAGSGSAEKPATPPAPKPATPAPAAKPPAAGSAAGSGGGPAKLYHDPNDPDGSGSAGGSGGGSESDAGSGSTIDDPLGASSDEPPEELISTTREFPTGDGAAKVIKGFTDAHAVRNLGKVPEDKKKEYKLDDTSTTLSIVFRDKTYTFVVGGSPYGNRDRYALDTDTGIGYVLSGELISPLEQGESGLRLTDPRGFDANSIHQVTVSTPDQKSRVAQRMMADPPKAEGSAKPVTTKTKTWGDPAVGKPDQTLANFVDNADRMRPTKYEAALDRATLTEIVKLTYRDQGGKTLGSMTLYKGEKAPDPANPAAPAGGVEYYVVTEKTRVPGVVPKGTAERVEQDIATLFAN
jgi:hypothetical protein